MMPFTLRIEKLNSSTACGIVSKPTYAQGATATMARMPRHICEVFNAAPGFSGPQKGARLDQLVMGENMADTTIITNAVARPKAMIVWKIPDFRTPLTDRNVMIESTPRDRMISPAQMS